jgi:hypothetical protein
VLILSSPFFTSSLQCWNRAVDANNDEPSRVGSSAIVGKSTDRVNRKAIRAGLQNTSVNNTAMRLGHEPP